MKHRPLSRKTTYCLSRGHAPPDRAHGHAKVRAFVETQTGDIQAAFPALERLLAARAREEREAAERGPGGSSEG